MKKVLSLFLVASMIFGLGSCTKEAPNQGGQNPFYVPGGTTNPGGTGGTGGGDPEPTPSLPVGDVPAAFGQKVVLEEGTGEWCGWCPEGAKIMEDAIAANPGKVIGISVHDGDPMEIVAYNTWWKSYISLTGFPNGTVSRRNAGGRGSWNGWINTDLGQTPDCGIALVTKESGGMLDVDAYVGYNKAIPGDTRITIVITENDVPQTTPGAQSNYSSTVTVGPGWTHGHVLRGIVTTYEGDKIDLTNTTNKYTKVSFKGVSLAGMKIVDMSKVHVAAYVNVNTGATAAGSTNGKWILNAQDAKLTETKKWD